MTESRVAWGTGVVLLLAATVVFSILPPYPAVRGSTPLDVLTPLHYQVGVFLPFGILLVEAAREWAAAPGVGLLLSYAVQFGVIVCFSLLRLALFIPVSGHCLLLAYYLLREGITLRLRYRMRFAAGAVILLHVLYYKTFVWRDPITPTAGFLVGALAWGAGRWFDGRQSCGKNAGDTREHPTGETPPLGGYREQ
jgi:hypothetical protein